MSKLHLDRVSFSYNQQDSLVHVLDDVTLTINEGEFVSIIGPSGCGKSTLLSLLSGLNFPSDGRIVLGDKILDGPGLERGVVFQHYSLFPWMSARKNIIFGLEQLKDGRSHKELEAVTDKYLELVGLGNVGEKYPSQLSGGMQQRVAIARAFAMDSQMLLMDEPFSAVDAKNRSTLQELLLELWDGGEKKKTVVFVTHDVDEAILLSDRIIVMSTATKSVREEVAVDFERPRHRCTLSKCPKYINLRNSLVQSLFDDIDTIDEVESAV